MGCFTPLPFQNCADRPRRFLSLRGGARVRGGERVAVALADGVTAAATVLAVVGVVALAPCLGVQGAVGSLRDTVLRKDIGVDKVLRKGRQSISEMKCQGRGIRTQGS